MSRELRHRHEHAVRAHVHEPDQRDSSSRRLALALALTGTFMLVEIVAGFVTGSLALLSDAGHMFTDAGALVLALIAQAIARRTRSAKRTFGFRRAEILAALANGSVLAVSSVWIMVEAVRRFRHPVETLGLPMLVVAALGLLVNIIAAVILSRGGHTNANLRAATAHVVADAAGSVAAILAGIAVWQFGLRIADPVSSLVISVLVLSSAWRLVRDALDVLMESTPRGIDMAKLEESVRSVPGVLALHDLHAWTISDGFPIVTVHVVLDGQHHGTDVAARVAQRIRETHGIEHVTVQPEAPDAPVVPVSSLVKRART